MMMRMMMKMVIMITMIKKDELLFLSFPQKILMIHRRIRKNIGNILFHEYCKWGTINLGIFAIRHMRMPDTENCN